MNDDKQNGAALAVREKTAAVVSLSDVFGTVASFEAAQRIGRMLSTSSLVPDTYKGDGNIGNCVIALEMANRIGMNVISVMQNMYIVHGRPAWSSQFLISCINASGKFSPLRYMMEGEEGKDSWGCRAWAQDRSGEKLVGPLVSVAMAKMEGWYGKNGSKWKTMPELMLRYRAATLFARLYSPELTMGIMTADEVEDVRDMIPAAPASIVEPPPVPAPGKSRLGARLAKAKKAEEAPAPDKEQEATPSVPQDPERDDLISRLMPFFNGFPKRFRSTAVDLGLDPDEWQTAPVDAMRSLLAKLDEAVSSQ